MRLFMPDLMCECASLFRWPVCWISRNAVRCPLILILFTLFHSLAFSHVFSAHIVQMLFIYLHRPWMNLTLCGWGEIKMMPHHIKYALRNWVKVCTQLHPNKCTYPCTRHWNRHTQYAYRFHRPPNLIMKFSLKYPPIDCGIFEIYIYKHLKCLKYRYYSMPLNVSTHRLQLKRRYCCGEFNWNSKENNKRLFKYEW